MYHIHVSRMYQCVSGWIWASRITHVSVRIRSASKKKNTHLPVSGLRPGPVPLRLAEWWGPWVIIWPLWGRLCNYLWPHFLAPIVTSQYPIHRSLVRWCDVEYAPAVSIPEWYILYPSVLIS